MDHKKAKKNTAYYPGAITDSIFFRIILIVLLILILLIPFSMIESLIDERSSRREAVISEIWSSWSYAQTLTGPVLSIPYQYFKEVSYKDAKEVVRKELVRQIDYAHFLPQELVISGEIQPEIRYRGIYQTTVYTGELNLTGSFNFPAIEKLNIKPADLMLEQAVFSMGLSDMKGISKNFALNWNNDSITPEPGSRFPALFGQGINCSVLVHTDKSQSNSFGMKLTLKGSESLDFVPVGRKTSVRLQSSWKSPQFYGTFLPGERKITEDGFSAAWEVYDYNRAFPQQWREMHDIPGFNQFGVKLISLVDHYQKSTRSIKYAILFIFLTCLAFFLFAEIFNRKKIHPIQYLLVGFALTLFYLLLIAISEHTSFNFAYFISAVCVVLLTTFYVGSISKNKVLTLFMGLLMAALYGFLYVILQLEDYALLMGSIGLFIILAAVMITTRQIDWFSFRINAAEAKKEPPHSLSRKQD